MEHSGDTGISWAFRNLTEELCEAIAYPSLLLLLPLLVVAQKSDLFAFTKLLERASNQ